MALRGYFILDDQSKGGVITTSFELSVKTESRVVINLDVQKTRRLHERLSKIDMGFYVVSADGRSQIMLSEFGFGSAKGICDLRPGNYFILPYTTSCVLKDSDAKSKKNQSKQSKALITSGGKLSNEFEECIDDIFKMFDLDADHYLSKQEFANYFKNSEDEPSLDDKAWQLILDRVGARDERISYTNFKRLFELEIDDANDDTEDLYTGLMNLGISKALMMEEACSYTVEIFTEASQNDVKFTTGDELTSVTGPIREAIVAEAMSEGFMIPCKELEEVGAVAYAYSDDQHAKVVIDYPRQTKSRIQVRLDASESAACLFSSSGSLRNKDGNSAGIRSVATCTINNNKAVPILCAVPNHPDRMAEFVISSIELIK